MKKSICHVRSNKSGIRLGLRSGNAVHFHLAIKAASELCPSLLGLKALRSLSLCPGILLESGKITATVVRMHGSQRRPFPVVNGQMGESRCRNSSICRCHPLV